MTDQTRLSDAAKQHLKLLIFDVNDGIGSLELPDDADLADELRTWLSAFGATPTYGEGEESEDIDLLESFTFTDDDQGHAFAAAVASLQAEASHDTIVFHNRLPQKSQFAIKDGKKLNLLKCKESREVVPFAEVLTEPNNNPRKSTTRRGLLGLAISISKTGLRHDIGVRPHPSEDGKYLVIYGYRRYLAIQYAIEQGWLKPNYTLGVRLIQCNDQQALLYALEENNGREEVDPLDQAEALAELRTQYTVATLATQNGMSEAALSAQIALAVNASDEAKALYRQGVINFEQLKAFSAGSVAKQQAILKSTLHLDTMRPEYIVRVMMMYEFKLNFALFTLEDYLNAGGEYEPNLFYPEAGRLNSLGLVQELQLKAIEARKAEFLKEGYGEVVVYPDRQSVPFDKFARAGVQVSLKDRLVVIFLEADLSVVITKDGVWTRSDEDEDNAQNNVAQSQQTSSSGTLSPHQNPITPKAPAPADLLTERATQLSRRHKTSALQFALMGQANHHMITVLTVYSMIDASHGLLQRRSANGSDEIIHPLILSALEQWSNRLPSVGVSSTSGLRASHNAGLELLTALIECSQADLDELLQLLVATSFGEWNVPPNGYATSAGNPLARALANHLGVQGHEAWQPNKEYLAAIGYNKPALKPYLEKLFGATVAGQLLTSATKAGLVDEILKKPDGLVNWTPPELAFGNSGIVFKPNLGSQERSPKIEETPFVPSIGFEDAFANSIAAD
jgi:ParB/RepB/Spo0J family partition protein